MNLPWYIPVIIAFLGGFLLGWQGCEREKPVPCPEIEIVNGEVFPEKPTVEVKKPEVKEPVKEEPVRQISHGTNSHGKNTMVSKDKYDSLATAFNALSTYRTYADSVSFTNLVVTYRAQTEGYLNDIDIGIVDNRPTLVETRTITLPPKIKVLRGIYGGIGMGGNKNSFSNFAPSVLYVAPKIAVGYDYNVIDQSNNVTVHGLIFGW